MDGPERRSAVEQLIREKALSFTQVIGGERISCGRCWTACRVCGDQFRFTWRTSIIRYPKILPTWKRLLQQLPKADLEVTP